MYTSVFVVTGAYFIPNMTLVLERERYIEYMLCLNKVFSFNKPVYGVCSEMVSTNSPNIPPFEKFPFQTLLRLDKQSTDDLVGKSSKEFFSIQTLLGSMKKDTNISDDTFIIKASGRYLMVKDTVVHLCESHFSNPDIQGFVRFAKDPGNLQQYTFLFALRWKHFKAFYEQSLEELGNKNVERFIVEYFEKNNLHNKVVSLSELGILANINNENRFAVF